MSASPLPLRSSFTLGALVAALGLALAASAQAAQPGWTTVASGLNNPRGLDFAPNGALYIAEAGTGGSGPELPGPEGGVVRFGLSGSITRVFKGQQERVVTGLPSLANPQRAAAIGPMSVSFGNLGHAFVTIGLGRNPALREQLGAAGAGLAGVYQLNQGGQLKRVVDVAPFEADNDPDGYGPDTNPTGIIPDTAGGAYFTDSGGNTLLRVDARGRLTTVAVFPNRIVATPPFLPQPPFPAQLPMQSVPTNVVRGPDGALYVSELTGFPFVVGASRIHRIVPGSAPTVYATGFTCVIDLDFDSRGNLYVLEIDSNGLAAPGVGGRLVRINAGGGAPVVVASTGLIMPGGLKVGPDDAPYVSNMSTSPDIGEVVRIQP